MFNSPFLFSPQLVLFGLNNQLVVSYKEENTMALKHLFLKGYSGVDEDDYSVAVYTKHDVYESLFYVMDQASNSDFFTVALWSVCSVEFYYRICTSGTPI